MRLSSSLIAVCKLAFCIQSYSVICSAPRASALTANPPRKGPRELRVQELCPVPSPLGTSLFFSRLQTAILVFSPQFTCLFYAEREFFGRSFPLLCVGEPAHLTPEFHQHLRVSAGSAGRQQTAQSTEFMRASSCLPPSAGSAFPLRAQI